MPDQRDLVHHFADYAAKLNYEDLPEAARLAAKKTILDTLGVILAASGTEPAVRGLVEIVKESGGTPNCTLLGFGGRALSNDGSASKWGARPLP